MQENRKGSWGEVIRTFFWALVIAMIFRSFLFQPFHIPSGSMKPSLLIGDYLIVSKYSYGYSKHSFPLSPDVFSGRVWYTEPKRGDIVVFKVPGRNNGEDVFIKRLVGLPGDEIQLKNGKLFINGTESVTVADGEYYDTEKHANMNRYFETLEGGVKHWILDESNNIFTDNTEVYKVPEGHFFMMGDNRDNSMDSRFPVPGPVPAENLIGRAEIILFSSDGQFVDPSNWRIDRFFTLLR